MSDLISRQDAIEAIASRDETNGNVKVFTGRQVNEILSDLPSARPTDGDLISRDEALQYIDKITNSGCGKSKSLEYIRKYIERMDSARPTGEWIGIESEPYCKCSVCGTYIDDLDDYYSFCPFCGADMRGDDE